MNQNEDYIELSTSVDLRYPGDHPDNGRRPSHKEEPGRQTGDADDAGARENTEEKQNKRLRLKELIDGTILVRENMVRQIPYILFLTFLGIIYIGNRFYAERMVRKINTLSVEVENLRAEQITTTSELMNISRPSEVSALIESKGLGLKELTVPPKKLKRK